MILLAGGDELHEIILFQSAVDNFKIGDDSSERIENRVENKGLQRSIGVPFRRWHTLYDSLKHIIDTHPGFAARPDNILAVATEKVNNLVFYFIGLGTVKVTLVDNRNYLQVVVDCHVEVGYGLGLDSL